MHLRSNWFPLVLIAIILFLVIQGWLQNNDAGKKTITENKSDCWTGAGEYQIPVNSQGDLIRYGRDLIVRTAYYLGPKGCVAHISNGMNCQNCHLEAGTKPWGNNYGAVAATYPKFRERSGTVESIVRRVNDCIERSLNGQAIDSNSHEMKQTQGLRHHGSSAFKKSGRPGKREDCICKRMREMSW